MIKLKNISLSYNENVILENVSISISKPGIYLFYGESGCGKTSLLNIIGLMENNYQGTYELNGKDVFSLSEKDKEKARGQLITYIFQTPKLIENESIITNLELVLGRNLKKEEIKEYLTQINISNGKQLVSKLSGGEKQRVNILLALLRDTPIILGDEITSGLDMNNKIVILKMLKKISSKKIIILVTHDVEIYNKYCLISREVKNKTFDPIVKKGKLEIRERINNSKLTNKYLYKHVINIMNQKKMRAIISIFSSAIALVCLGLCLLLTSSLSNSVLSSLGQLINDKEIIMEKREETYLIDEKISINQNDMMKIYSKYHNSINYFGIKYITDIDSFFEDENYFAFSFGERGVNLHGYSVNDINNFTFISNEEKEQFFLTKNILQEDEVVISLTYNEINNLCRQLNIEYVNEASLLNYLKEEPLMMKMYLANENWEYYLESNLYLVGYEINDERHFYHTNSFWNEYIIEEVMQLNSNLNLNEIDYYPWTVKKEYYLSVDEENLNIVLSNLLKDQSLNDYTFKTYKRKYDYEITCRYAHDNYLRVADLINLTSENDYLTNYIPCSKEGYNVVNEAMIKGFAYPMFISNNYELLEEYIDINSYSEYNFGAYQSTILSNNNDMVSLSLLDASKSNFCNIKISDYDKNKINQIKISSSLASLLGIYKNSEDFARKNIYLVSLKDIVYANDLYRNDFEIVKLEVIDIVDDDECCIYTDNLWSLLFEMVYMERENLGIEKVIFTYTGDDVEKSIKELNEKYPDYIFQNPYLDYKKEIQKAEHYLTMGLSLFSAFCLLSTFLMLILSSGLFISETKREIGIYTIYGYERKSILKQYKIFSYLMMLYSLLVSMISLLVVMILINKGFLNISFNFYLEEYTSFLVMGITSLLIGFLTSRITTRRIMKEKPLQQINE